MLLGVLQCLDGYMNIAMEQTEEHVNGVVTNRYGDAFIRGNNGISTFTFHIDVVLSHPPKQCSTFRLGKLYESVQSVDYIGIKVQLKSIIYI